MQTKAPDPTAVLARLSTLTRLLYEAFEIATQIVRAYFDKIRAPVDPWLAAMWTRFLVKRILAERGQEVEEEEIEQENVPNVGLWLRFGEDQIRIWKAVRGGILESDNSDARIAYFSQEPLPGFEDAQNPHKYIIAWDVDDKFSLKGLLLALPRSATRVSVKLHWPVVPIPHPALAIEPDRAATAQLAEDLAIEIDQAKTDIKGME